MSDSLMEGLGKNFMLAYACESLPTLANAYAGKRPRGGKGRMELVAEEREQVLSWEHGSLSLHILPELNKKRFRHDTAITISEF